MSLVSTPPGTPGTLRSHTLYPPPPYLYPMNTHIFAQSSNLFNFSFSLTIAHGALNAHKSPTSRFIPHTISYGVQPSTAAVRVLFRHMGHCIVRFAPQLPREP